MIATATIATDITAMITAAGLDPATYLVAKLARLVAKRIAEFEEDYWPHTGEITTVYGISEADLWEGLGLEWDTDIPATDAACAAAYDMAESFPAGSYGRYLWADECRTSARRNRAAA